MVKLLFDEGVSINHPIQDKAPILWAIKKGIRLNIVKLFLDQGATLEDQDDYGRTPLGCACLCYSVKRYDTLEKIRL